MKVHFVTFGDGSKRLRLAALRLSAQARSSGKFDTVQTFTVGRLVSAVPHEISPHLSFIRENSRGCGLWIWKPILINHMMNELPRGDLLVYSDAGNELNLRPQSAQTRLLEYVDYTMNEQMLIFHRGMPEQLWTRPSVSQTLGCGNAPSFSQVEANVIFFRVHRDTAEFVDSWRHHCALANRKNLVEPEDSEELGTLIAHRHDQSVLSCLFSTSRYRALESETYFGPSTDSLTSDWLAHMTASSGHLSVEDRATWLSNWFKDRYQHSDARLTSLAWQRRGSAFPIWTSRNKGPVPLHTSRFFWRNFRKFRNQVGST